MTELFAQPYDISARGFYFQTAEEYEPEGKAAEEIGELFKWLAGLLAL